MITEYTVRVLCLKTENLFFVGLRQNLPGKGTLGAVGTILYAFLSYVFPCLPSLSQTIEDYKELFTCPLRISPAGNNNAN